MELDQISIIIKEFIIFILLVSVLMYILNHASSFVSTSLNFAGKFLGYE